MWVCTQTPKLAFNRGNTTLHAMLFYTGQRECPDGCTCIYLNQHLTEQTQHFVQGTWLFLVAAGHNWRTFYKFAAHTLLQPSHELWPKLLYWLWKNSCFCQITQYYSVSITLTQKKSCTISFVPSYCIEPKNSKISTKFIIKCTLNVSFIYPQMHTKH